ncbi:MAG TPA: tetratricopeptide repeat protein [Rhizomicrobium sp.]|jgi:tetratricopeptide (TPR) repeat protein|nr:tetratricopeptide repeat protein [Rhizomicrobium sp.]
MKTILSAVGLLLLATVQALASAYSDFNAGLSARLHHPDLAIGYFTSALADPALLPSLRPVALFDRGGCYFQSKQYDLALIDLSASLALKPDFDAYMYRGLVYYRQHKPDAALADFSAAVALRPDVPKGLYIRMNFEMETRRYREALADGGALIAIEPESANYSLLATANRLSGDYAAALSAADTAISLDANSSVPRFNKVTVLETAGRLEEALDAVTDALKYRPQSVLGPMKKGVVQWELQRYDAAAETFADALKTQRGNAYAHLWLTISRNAAHVDDSDATERATHIDRNAWPAPLVQLYQGTSTPAQVMAAAHLDPNAESGQVCEAEFYTAQWQMMRGRTGTAKALLASAVRDCPFGFVEAPAAANQLKALP